MPGSPSNVARTKTTAVSTYNEAGKDYFLLIKDHKIRYFPE